MANNDNVGANPQAYNGNGLLTVSSDPIFSGSNSKVTAEEWLRAMCKRSDMQQYSDKQAIAYAKQHLTGQAAAHFDLLEDLDRKAAAEAENSWPKWQTLFKEIYFRAANQAETILDWVNLRQASNESAGDFYIRIQASVRSFFTNANGTCPFSTVTSESDFKLSTEAQATIDKTWEDKGSAKLAQVITDGITRDSRLTAGAAATEADEATWTARIKTIKETVHDAIQQPTIIRSTYQAIFDNTSRALVLKTLHTGLRHQKCKEEVFQYLKHPQWQMRQLLISLKQIETSIENNGHSRNNGNSRSIGNHNSYQRNLGPSNRGRVNAVHSEDNFDGEEEDTSSHQTDTESIIASLPPEVIAAISDKVAAATIDAISKRNGQTSKDNSKQTPSEGKKKKYCSFCRRPGHTYEECRNRRERPNNKPSEN